MKTKTKKKTAGKKAAKRKTGAKSGGSKKQLDAAQVRAEIAGMVKEGAKDLAEKIISNATDRGELGPTKYLFEMAGIFPPQETEGGTNQDAVARSLMRALGIPEDPITYDEEGNVVSPGKDPDGRGGAAEKKSDGDEKCEDESEARAAVRAPHDPPDGQDVPAEDGNESDPVE
jgi:hypothetical protein